MMNAIFDFPGQQLQIGSMKYRVVIEADEDGVFVAECPSLPGCISQGKTLAEALASIKDAMIGYLASLTKHGETRLAPTRSPAAGWPGTDPAFRPRPTVSDRPPNCDRGSG